MTASWFRQDQTPFANSHKAVILSDRRRVAPVSRGILSVRVPPVPRFWGPGRTSRRVAQVSNLRPGILKHFTNAAISGAAGRKPLMPWRGWRRAARSRTSSCPRAISPSSGRSKTRRPNIDNSVPFPDHLFICTLHIITRFRRKLDSGHREPACTQGEFPQIGSRPENSCNTHLWGLPLSKRRQRFGRPGRRLTVLRQLPPPWDG